jgi:hypothetical protein
MLGVTFYSYLLNDVMLSVIILNVIMITVVAPLSLAEDIKQLKILYQKSSI